MLTLSPSIRVTCVAPTRQPLALGPGAETEAGPDAPEGGDGHMLGQTRA